MKDSESVWNIVNSCVYVHKAGLLNMWFWILLMLMMMNDSKNFISISSSNKMQEKNYFKCFRLFLETWKKLDDSLKWKYYEALLEYWLNWIKPTDPIIDALLTSAMYSIDKTDEWMKKKSESMMWNANAVKNFEKVSKQKKTEQNRNKQKQTEENIWRNKKNIEEKEDKEEDNTITQTNIILSDDTDAKASEYWNEDINKCLNLVKQYNWWLIDWTIKESRRYAKLLIDKLKKLESIQSWKYTREQTLDIILKVISQNKYYSSKITSTESIYRNLAVLMQACKKDISKQQGSTIILQTI